MKSNLEYPITGLIVNPTIPTKLNFLGEVDFPFFTALEVTNKLKTDYSTREQLEDILKIPKMGGKYFRYKSPKENSFYYFVPKQKSLQDFLLVAGHEEGHVIEQLNHLLHLEAYMQGQNVFVDFKSIQNPEIRATIPGLFAVDRAGYSLGTISSPWLKTPYIREAIKIYNDSKNFSKSTSNQIHKEPDFTWNVDNKDK
jgi:hypothetical protein